MPEQTFNINAMLYILMLEKYPTETKISGHYKKFMPETLNSGLYPAIDITVMLQPLYTGTLRVAHLPIAQKQESSLHTGPIKAWRNQ